MTSIFTSVSEDAIKDGTNPLQAAVDGYSLAFWAGAVFAIISVVVTLVVVRDDVIEGSEQTAAGSMG